jgi:uncharacterized membrane protein
MSVLIIGFTTVVLLMIVVVADLSKVFLAKRELESTADGAVLAAANGLAIYRQVNGYAEFDLELARRLAGDYLEAVDPGNQLEWSAEVSGTTVTVRLKSTVDLPFEPPGWQGSATIGSDAAAVVPVR